MSTTEMAVYLITAAFNTIFEVAKKRGYNCPLAICAQAACESAWGKSLLASKYYNFFGMKCGSHYSGKSVNMTTKEEYSKGTLTTIKDNFRAFDTLEAGINGYFDFIESYSRYSNLKAITDNDKYIETLKADGWATSSSYVSTLKSILHGPTLSKYITEHETPTEKTISDAELAIAWEVIAGKYSNGEERKNNLYNAIQKAVNRCLKEGK